MYQLNIYSNIRNIEGQRKLSPEFQDLLSSMECYNIVPSMKPLRSINDEGIQNIESSALYTTEFARLISSTSEYNVAVLFFPKIFISGFMLPLLQYLISRKIKIFICGLDNESHQRMFIQPGKNINEMPDISEIGEGIYEGLLDKVRKIQAFNTVYRNVLWTDLLPPDLVSDLNNSITEWTERGFVDIKETKNKYPDALFLNIHILSIIITRYRIPIGELHKMLTGELNTNKRNISRILAFIFFNIKREMLAPIFTGLPEIIYNESSAHINLTDFFFEVLKQIEVQVHRDRVMAEFIKNLTVFFIKTRIKVDPAVARRLKDNILPPLTEHEMKERQEIRSFIVNFGMLVPNQNNYYNKTLSLEDTKNIIRQIIFLIKRYGADYGSNMREFIQNAKIPFFRSRVFIKIVNFLNENPIYWQPEGFKRIVLNIHFDYQEMEHLFNFFRETYIVDHLYFSSVSNKFEKMLKESENSNLYRLFHAHHQKKIKIISEFEYIFIHERELSAAEKFLTVLGKYQLGIKFIKNDKEQFTSESFYKIPTEYNKIWQYPVSKISIEKKALPNIIEAHNLFIEKTVIKIFKEITGGDIGQVYAEFGKNTFNIIYEKVLTEMFCVIGYSQFYEILKKRLYISERQLEEYGYVRNMAHPEDYIYYNDFYIASDKENSEDIIYQQFNTLISNVVKHYHAEMTDITSSVNKSFIDKSERESLLKIIESLKQFERNALNDFRENNIFSQFLLDFLDIFCEELQTLFKRRNNNNIVICINEKYQFLRYFTKDVVKDLNGQIMRFYFCYNTKQNDDKISQHFLELLDKLIISEYKYDFERLLTVYKHIIRINKYVCSMQKLAGLLLTYEIVSQIHTDIKPINFNIQDLGFAEIDAVQKMLICTPESLAKIRISDLVKQNSELQRVHESFSSFNEGLNIYTRIFEEIEEIQTLATIFNSDFSMIPNIKFAPEALKLIRFKVKQISNILNTDFDQLTPREIEGLDRLCYEIWNNYLEVIKIENELNSVHRFWDIGYKQLRARLGETQIEKLVVFFKNGFDAIKNKKKLNNYLSYRILSSMLLKDKLNKKDYFFLVPVRGLKTVNIDIIKNLRKLKGLNVPIYVDRKESLGFQEDLYGYIPPHHFVDLTR